MPKIGWHSLPLRVKQLLIERLHDREIAQDDLESLKMWIDGNPAVPEGRGGRISARSNWRVQAGIRRRFSPKISRLSD